MDRLHVDYFICDQQKAVSPAKKGKLQLSLQSRISSLQFIVRVTTRF